MPGEDTHSKVPPLLPTEENLEDPEMVDKLTRFVRASMKGWKYAETNPDEAAEIVLENDATGAQTEKHQKRMMGEIAKLTAGSNGALDPADFQRTVDVLMSAGADPVITKEPEGAWTHAVTDKMFEEVGKSFESILAGNRTRANEIRLAFKKVAKEKTLTYCLKYNAKGVPCADGRCRYYPCCDWLELNEVDEALGEIGPVEGPPMDF